MWRGLTQAFGVIEAGDAGAARTWIERRPDIDAIVVQDELPAGLVKALMREVDRLGA